MNRSVAVVVHAKRLSDGALLYQDERPITDAVTRYGRHERYTSGTVIETYTDEQGVLDLRTVNQPTLWERAVYEWRMCFPGLGLFAGISVGGFAVVAPFVVSKRRRQT